MTILIHFLDKMNGSIGVKQNQSPTLSPHSIVAAIYINK